MRTALRLATWALVAAAAISLGAAAAIWLFVRTDQGRKPLARAIERELGAEVGGSASLRIVELDFDGRLVVENLMLRDPAGREVVRAANVSLRVDVDSLLHGEIRIDEISVTRPAVHVYAEGPWLARKPTPPGQPTSGGTKITIGRVVLLDGSAAVDRPGGRTVHARAPWAVIRPDDGALAAIVFADLAAGDAGVPHPGGRIAAIVSRPRDGASWQLWAQGTTDPGSFTLASTIAPDFDSADVTLRIADLDPRTLHAGAKPGRASGLAVLRARGLAAARAAAVAGSVIVRASGEYDGERVDDLLAVTTGSPDRSLTSLEVASPAGKGRALLRLKRDGGVMVFEEGSYFAGQVSAIERWIPQDSPVSGSAEVEIRITGPVNEPKLEGKVRLGDDVMVNAGPLGRIRAQGKATLLPGDRLALDRVELRWSAGTIVVSGEVDPNDTKHGDVALRLRVDKLDLARAQRALAPASRRKTPLDGKLTATIDLTRRAGATTAGATGKVQALRWRAGQAPVDVPKLSASLRGRRFGLDATLVGREGAGEASVSLAATAPRDPFDSAAWVRLGADQVTAARATFAGDLAWLAALAGVSPDATGRAAGEITLVDGPRRLAFTITGTELAHGEIDQLALELRGAIDGRTTTVESASATIDGEPVATATGTIDRGLTDLVGRGAGRGTAGAHATGRLAVTDLPLERLRPFGWDRDDVTGRLTGTLGITVDEDGPLASPTFTIAAALAPARIQRVDFSHITLDGTLTGRRFTGTLHADQTLGGKVDGTGSWDGTAGTVDAKIDATRFDLAFLRTFAGEAGDPLSEIGGRLDARVEVHGSIAAPTGTVNATLKGGTILLDEGVRQIERATLVGGLAAGRLDVSSLVIRSGRGHLSASGNARVVDLVPVDLHLELSARRMRIFAGGTLAEIDLDGTVAGVRTGRTWDLDAKVRRGTIRLPESDAERLQRLGPLEDVVFVDRRSVRGRLLAMTDLFRARPQSLVVRAEVDLGEGVKLKSSEVDALVDGSLTVTHAGTLQLKGLLTSLEGTVKIYGRRYDLLEAIVWIDGSVPAEPALDILLAREFRTATVYIHIGGTPDVPVLTLSSDPSIYDDAQLLGMVLGGEPDDRALGERPLEAKAASLTSQLLVNEVQALLGDLMPFDYLYVDPGGPGAYGGGGLEAGRWITERWLAGIRYRVTPEADENTLELQLTYEYLRTWIFDGRGGDRGILSGDILHVWRW